MQNRSHAPKSIVHIVSSLNIGGAERFTLDLCQVQQKNGYAVKILSLGSESDDLVEEVQKRGVPLEVASKWGGWRNLQTYLKLRRADILHFHSPHAIKLISLFLVLLQHQRIIYTRHGAAPLEAKTWRKIHQQVQPFIKALTFVSDEGMENFQKTHQWSSPQMQVIDNGIDLQSIDTWPVAKDTNTLRLGSVGRMVELKGQIELLKAVAILPEGLRTRIVIDFFGDGECRSILESYAKKHLPHTRVNFHGMVGSRSDIYNSFDVLCVTSKTEGLSLAVIEAMAHKKAVLATNVGGNPKLIEHKSNGLLYNYADTKTLSGYLRTLLDDAPQVSLMGEKGREKVENVFSLQATAAKFNTLYG